MMVYLSNTISTGIHIITLLAILSDDGLSVQYNFDRNTYNNPAIYTIWWWFICPIQFRPEFPPISTRLFCYITCTFKHTSLQLSKLKISQCFPFLIKNLQNLQKGDKLWNFKSKWPETRAFRIWFTCYITKKSCTDGGNPTTFFIFLSDQPL